MKLEQILAEDNKATKELYPSGQNHTGKNLEWFELEGHRIWAINLDHAKNILHQAKIDAE